MSLVQNPAMTKSTFESELTVASVIDTLSPSCYSGTKEFNPIGEP
jgi:hypothetical protein